MYHLHIFTLAIASLYFLNNQLFATHILSAPNTSLIQNCNYDALQEHFKSHHDHILDKQLIHHYDALPLSHTQLTHLQLKLSPKQYKHISQSSYPNISLIILSTYDCPHHQHPSVNSLYIYDAPAPQTHNYFRARYFDTEMGRFISRDPLGYVDGFGLYNAYFARMFMMDPSGLRWVMKCNRCWKLDACCEKRTGDWKYKCWLYNSSTGERKSTDANNWDSSQPGNSNSSISGDPYGLNGPLEPGNYEVKNQNSPKFGPKTPTVTNDGGSGVTTSKGNKRSGIRVHDAGSRSAGCISCNDDNNQDGKNDFVDDVRNAADKNGGALPLKIVDKGDCPCAKAK